MISEIDATTESASAVGAIDEALDLTNRRVAFMGRLEALNRPDLAQFVRSRGAIPVPSPEEADLLVVGITGLPIDDLDSLLTESQIREVAQGRVMVVSESRFWQMLGLVDVESGVRRFYTAAMLANLLKVPLRTIRRWHRRGLIVPAQMVHRLAYYDFQEVATARQLAKLIQSGVSPDALEAKLTRLAQLFPDVQRPLSQLSIIVEGQDFLLRHGAGLIEPGGQRRIDFAALDSTPTGPVTAPSSRTVDAEVLDSGDLVTPEQYRKLAADLEDEGRTIDAIHVYRSMLFAFGSQPDIHFALAELLYLQGDLSAARERYFIAIELDDSFLEARASLGCLLLELREPEMAISTLEGALKIHPEYADAHFHLARALDDCDRQVEAASHWRRFLNLAPDSPWADEARQRLATD